MKKVNRVRFGRIMPAKKKRLERSKQSLQMMRATAGLAGGAYA